MVDTKYNYISTTFCVNSFAFFSEKKCFTDEDGRTTDARHHAIALLTQSQLKLHLSLEYLIEERNV